MSQSAEQIALDEKIARIRKQNEEIIRRKQIIDEEIKNAKRNNAIVNPKKAYSNEDNDSPSMYSDSVATRQQKTVIYPKLRVSESKGSKINRQRNKQEEAAWRREREQIDNERIRRQKAASGWKREWDANKAFEDEDKPQLGRNQRDTTYKLQGRRPGGNEEEDKWNEKRDTNCTSQGRGSCETDDDWDVQRDIRYRSQPRKLFNNDNINISLGRKFNDNSNIHSVTARSDSESMRFSRKENEIEKPSIQVPTTIKDVENKSGSSWQTSGPLNQKTKSAIRKANLQNVIINKVTKYSETKVQTQPKDAPWKSDFSNKDDKNSVIDLNERLKNIVICVKNDDKKEVTRTIELMDEPLPHVGHLKLNLTNKVVPANITFNMSLPLAPPQTFTFSSSATRQSDAFSFGDAEKSLGLMASNKEVSPSANNDVIWRELTRPCSMTGILKKSPEISTTDESKKDEVRPKKSVVIQEAVNECSKNKVKIKKSAVIQNEEVVEDDGNDDEWEDDSDDEWEDVLD